ncbi:MAG: hypothetical protein R3Y16_00855 [Rikenellaceae bacterium]
MKKLFTLMVAFFAFVVCVNAQTKIEPQHPDFNFKITRCAQANGTVVIDVVITNYGAEESIYIDRNNISAYDDEGNIYTRGNSGILMGATNMGLNDYSKIVFPQDIPIKFRIQLDKINTNASKFALLKLGFESKGAMALDPKKPLQIRNLEWNK